jgi:hypothetical protein
MGRLASKKFWGVFSGLVHVGEGRKEEGQGEGSHSKGLGDPTGSTEAGTVALI